MAQPISRDIPMRLKTSLLLILSLLFSVFLASASFASKADELLAKADKLVADAQVAKHSADKNDNYNDAIKIYNDVAKQYSNTPEAARAMYQVAVVYGTAEGKVNNPRTGYDTLKQLINCFTYCKSQACAAGMNVTG